MGDVRFSRVYEQVRSAADLPTVLRGLPDLQVVEALAAASREGDPYLANVLATEALNRIRRCSAITQFLREGLVVLDREGRVVLLNPEGERLLGHRHADVLAADFHALVHHQHATTADLSEGELETVPRADCDLMRALRAANRVAVEDHDTFTRSDGTTFLAGFTAGAIEREGETEGLVVVFRDLTTRKGEEERLRMFHAATERAPQAIFWVQEDGHVVYANRNARTWLGYSEKEVTDLTMFDIDVRMDPAEWPAHWRSVKAEGEATLESVHRTRRGEEFPVRVRICHVDERGGEYHCAFVTRV